METRDVVVIGGGSTGSSILFNLAKLGVTNTLLIERHELGSGQTGRSTAIIRTHYSNPVVTRMALRSYNFFRDFEAELRGYGSGYFECGLLIGASAESRGGLLQNVKMHRALGIVSGILDRDQMKRLEPLLDPDAFDSVAYEPHAGYAEPSTTVNSFVQAAKSLGARTLLNTKVISVIKSTGGYTLSTDNGVVEAKKVVLATGVYSAPILTSLGINLPLKMVRHPVCIFRRPAPYHGARPIIFDLARACTLKPEGRSSLHVSSFERDLDNFGASVDPDHYDAEVSFEEMEKFTGWVAKNIPLMKTEGIFERSYTGVYDDTPDQQPIIDELSDYGFEDLYCLVGLSGHGFKLCPEFGRIMAELITTKGFHDYDISIFRSRRFASGELIRSRYSVSTVG